MLVVSAASAVVAAILAYAFFLLCTDIYNNTEKYQQRIIASVQASSRVLQAYVDKNGVNYADHEKIRNWQKETGNTIFFYGSKEELDKRIREDEEYTNTESRRLWRMRHAVAIRFADETIYVYLDNRKQRILRGLNTLLTIAMVGIVYSFTMLVFMRRDVAYMMYLCDELELMRGGDLTRSIAVKNSHELGDIGSEIDALRQDFAGLIKKEQEAVTANHDLVASMSHDLRTPLTRLIGYLEIIKLKKYEGNDQLQDYVDKASNNAFIIKDVTDQLFHYFTAFKHEEFEPRLEEIEGSKYINGILEEQIDYLRSRDFKVLYTPPERPFIIRIYKAEFPRIFFNLFQNIERYADSSKPVEIKCTLEKDMLILTFENSIRRERANVESTNLGLKIVARIVNMLDGSMETQIRDDIYSTRVFFPVQLKMDREREDVR